MTVGVRTLTLWLVMLAAWGVGFAVLRGHFVHWHAQNDVMGRAFAAQTARLATVSAQFGRSSAGGAEWSATPLEATGAQATRDDEINCDEEPAVITVRIRGVWAGVGRCERLFFGLRRAKLALIELVHYTHLVSVSRASQHLRCAPFRECLFSLMGRWPCRCFYE